jgi:hypothetical protein
LPRRLRRGPSGRSRPCGSRTAHVVVGLPPIANRPRGRPFAARFGRRLTADLPERLVDLIIAPETGDVEFQRALHTLKGSGALFGLDLGEEVGTVFTVSRVELEHAIAELARNKESDHLIRFLESWQHELRLGWGLALGSGSAL